MLGTIDADKSYDLFMKTYIWGGADRNDVYFDEPNRHEFVTYRMDACFIANALLAKGEKEKDGKGAKEKDGDKETTEKKDAKKEDVPVLDFTK